LKNKYINILFSIFLFTQFVISQTTRGIIKGAIYDEKTKEPLPGVNIYVKGTTKGAVTNSKGIFEIKKIVPGTYDVRISLLGYNNIIKKIDVQPGTEINLEIFLTPTTIQTEQVIVTASRREQSLREVPVSVSTVTSKMISDRVAVRLDDVVRYVPGVNMTMDQVNIRGSSGYSRGVGSRVLVLIDGLPYLTGDTGEITWETFPTHQIDKVEVVKGPGSSLYGSNALGGVINIITKQINASPEFQYKLFCGIYDQAKYSEWKWSNKTRFNSGLTLSYSGWIDSLGYLLSVSRSVDESYRANDVYHRWGLYSKLSYILSESNNLTLISNVQWRRHQNFFWWKSLNEATRPADKQLNWVVNSTRGNVSVSYNSIISNNFFYSLKGIYHGNFWKDDSSGLSNYVSASHFAQLESQFTYTFSQKNILTTGMLINYDRVFANIFGYRSSIGAAFYAQDEIVPARNFRINAGIRYDWQKIWKDNFHTPLSISPSEINPKLGIMYSITPSSTIRASYGKGFRYPSISELFTSVYESASSLPVVPNEELKPERSNSYEIGYLQLIGEHSSLDVSIFQNDFFDLIEAGVNKRNEIQFTNVTRARIKGFEVGIQYELIKRTLLTNLNYTYMDPVDLTQNVTLKFRPRHLFYGSMELNLSKVQIGLDYRYVSRVETIDEDFVKFAPIIDGDKRVPIKVIDLRTSYNLLSIGIPARLSFVIKNLTNYYYIEMLGNIAPFRTYYLSIEGGF